MQLAVELTFKNKKDQSVEAFYLHVLILNSLFI